MSNMALTQAQIKQAETRAKGLVTFGTQPARPDVFELMLRRASRQDVKLGTKKSIQWFREQIGSLDRRNYSRNKLLNMDERRVGRSFVGHGFFYKYDPKHAKTLPYYDVFPYVFPFHVEPDRFWGINMHYLPIVPRARALGYLYSFRTNKMMDESTKLHMSWGLLKSFSIFKPCVKEYLFSHVRSPFVNIGPEAWATSVFLPVAKFKKATQQEVWRDS
jgi:hypothetical protein